MRRVSNGGALVSTDCATEVRSPRSSAAIHRAVSNTGEVLIDTAEEVRLTNGAGLAARVVTVEYLGADSIVTCAAGAEMLALRAPGRVELSDGTPVRLTWHPDAVHLFDAVSGKRIEQARPAFAHA